MLIVAVFYANSLDIPMLLMANTAFISFVFIFKMILKVFRRFQNSQNLIIFISLIWLCKKVMKLSRLSIIHTIIQVFIYETYQLI